MPLPLLLATVAATLHVATAAAMLALSRAPGWERLRAFAVVAGTVSAYSLTNVVAQLWLQDTEGFGVVLRMQLINGAIHAASWLLYTGAPSDGRWRSLRPADRLAIRALVFGVPPIAAFAPVAAGDPRFVPVPSLGSEVVIQPLSVWGTIAALASFAALAAAFVRFAVAWRRREPGAGLVAAGFFVFFLCSLEEALVASGVIRFIYLADVGFLAIMTPVAFQTIGRLRKDAALLVDLSDQLSETVERRTAERDEAQSRLVEQERLAALGRLAAGVGHEVNNPLAYVGANLELLREELGDDAPAGMREALADAEDGVRRIREVVAGLRTYARPADETFRPLDLNDVARDAVRVGRAGSRRGAAEPDVAFLPADAPVPALGDAGRLVQVGVNLVLNAMQAASDAADDRPPHVAVSVRIGDDGWRELRVEDSGRGFDPAVLSRLGEPYVTTRAQDGGTGLGLFVSRGILDAHGGALLVESRAEGGTRVLVRLPPGDAIALPEVASRDASATGRPDGVVGTGSAHATGGASRRVALVDDEPLVREGLARALRRNGHRVDAFATAEGVLDALADGSRYDVVVSDLMMPGTDGIALAAALEAKHPSLRATLIVITGGATTPAARAFVARDDVTVVKKPVDVAALSRRIGESVSTTADALTR